MDLPNSKNPEQSKPPRRSEREDRILLIAQRMRKVPEIDPKRAKQIREEFYRDIELFREQRRTPTLEELRKSAKSRPAKRK